MIDDTLKFQCELSISKFIISHQFQHHCRRCGHIFCNKCCSAKVQFHRMGFVDPVRLCTPCATVTKQEEEFFNTHLKLLFAGNKIFNHWYFATVEKVSTSNNIPIQIKFFLGATFNVSTSVKSIESPLSDVIQNDLQSRKEDRRSPSLSNFSSDKDKLSSGKFFIMVMSF